MADQTEILRKDISERLRRANVGSHLWSTAYHCVLGASTVLGLVAAGWAKFGVDSYVQKDVLVAILATGASILTFVGGFGGFQRKWRANRRSRAAMQKLLILLAAEDVDLAYIQKQLFKAIDEHEGLIVGDPSETSPAVPSGR